MNKNILSKIAQRITPYQWEKNVGPEVLRFDANTLPGPPPCVNKLLAELKDNCPINEYGDPSYAKLKKLISKYENTPVNTITLTNSGDEALDIIGKAFLNDGDNFLIQPPTYEIFKSQCEINKGKAVEVPLLKKTFKPDVKNVIKVLKNLPIKITFICNPNNPTGTITEPEDIKLILKNTSGIVLVDEAYREFYGVTYVPLLAKYDNLVILRSFSKFGAMAGTRVGYLIANKKLSQVFDAIRFPLGVSYFSCKLAEKLLEENKKWINNQIEIIKKERERLSQSLLELGLFVYPSQANFILVGFGKNADKIYQKLKENNILVRNRNNKKYLVGCIRITIRSKKQNNILINNLKKIL
ncbi:MAG: histidinol-phosphate transaminase [Patescibacteria group bacterium]|jgi:histidinol-phosphate aminotransferase